MHSDSLAPWQKRHSFLANQHGKNARRTTMVLALTVVMMVAEIIAGSMYGSMALLADGWHMASHAAALGIAAFAYAYARRHAENNVYTFGTGKVGDLVSAWMLKDDHDHGQLEDGHLDHHDEIHGHDHQHHRDHNLRAAYVHVLTDAVTSVLAIAALAAGLYWGITWLDAVMGLVGAAIIAQWSWSLIAATGRVLLDAAPSGDTTVAVRKAIESEPDNRIADLHVWRVGPGHLAAVMTVVTHHPRPPAHYKNLLAGIPSLSHVTIEVELCCDQQPQAA